ncbi:MAG TPA: GxxExxY protein [Gemmatimonadaceae bacterium]|nr:GxxExxY protein [Gemmatimonadaceae bacterium]
MSVDESELTATIIGAAIEVHRHVRAGSFEAVYHHCLAWELEQRSLRIRKQVAVPLVYKGVRFDLAYRVDLLVEERVVVEVKSIERVLPVHESQIVTYLTLLGVRTGLLLNFNVPLMRDGVRRFVV